MDPWKLGPLQPETVNNIPKIKTEDSFTRDKRVEDMFNIFSTNADRTAKLPLYLLSGGPKKGRYSFSIELQQTSQ